MYTTDLMPPHAASSTTSSRKATRSEPAYSLNQNRRVTGTTEILNSAKTCQRLEHGIGNDFDMDTAEFTEFRAQFLADFAQIPLIIGIDGRSGTGKTSLAAP